MSVNRAFGRDYGSGGDGRPPVPGMILMLAGVAAIVIFYAHSNGTLTTETLIGILVIAPSVIIHEISHGWLANKFGDNTAKRAGRLTLNPLRHVDPLGTFILPGILLLTTNGSTAFGWAKPVPVNTSGMSRNKSMFVGLIGPATNVVQALLAALALHLVFDRQHSLTLDHKDWYYWTIVALVAYGRTNVVLAVYNMIPIPPLDGSSLVERFLPQKYMYQYLQFRKYSIILLLFLMLAYGRVLAYLFDPAIRLWANLLPHV